MTSIEKLLITGSKFNGTTDVVNFLTWASSVKLELQDNSDGAFEAVDDIDGLNAIGVARPVPTESAPLESVEYKEMLKAWNKMNIKAKAIITKRLDERGPAYAYVCNMDYARDMWKALNEMYMSKDINGFYKYLVTLMGARRGSDESVALYYQKFSRDYMNVKSVITTLAKDGTSAMSSNATTTTAVDFYALDLMASVMFMNQIGSEYDVWRQTTVSTIGVKDLSLRKLYESAVAAEGMKSSAAAADAAQAYYANEDKKGNNNSNVKLNRAGQPRQIPGSTGFKGCFNCNKPDHLAKDCPDPPRNQRNADAREAARPKGDYNNSNKKNSQQNAKKESGNVAAELLEFDDEIILMASAGGVVPRWILDSGATSHMVGNRDILTGVTPIDPRPIGGIGGHSLVAIGIGSLDCILGGELITLKDVLFVPKLTHQLVSVAKLMQDGKDIVFKENSVVYGGNVIARMQNSLFDLDITLIDHAMIASVDNPDIWHRRLGHAGISAVNLVRKYQMAEGINSEMSAYHSCDCCILGKSTRPSFDYRPPKRKAKPFALVHTDLAGPVKPESYSKKKYVMTIVDDCTRYVWIYFLREKSEATSKFQEWLAMVDNQFGYGRVKALHSDGGGEYLNNTMDTLLKARGIEHLTTCPHTPQQNGIAERFNGTLFNKVRCMLLDGNVAKIWWAEAASTAAYIHNRLPTKVLKDHTPYQALLGEKPDISHMRVFGCVVYCHVSEYHIKLDDTAVKCIFCPCVT
ncbi:DNA-directed DNA polymerase [Synchytrium microbalum]|uniref:DNA-directed DNA polymerase n=1 Tax=Synchytrium microbalum TaxID=1806994 RepID=A0A507BQV0_9FUNG|nr:DNA-directed DNA polymerase [Synchytrium microbalum]TPX29978.1 DNA-directed DNA polymerase [Synchytrium microbalum]